MLSILHRATRSARAPAVATLAVFSLLGPSSAAAQTWSGGGCSGCHGTPPTIASSVTNGDCGANFDIGVGEAFMASAAALLSRVNQAGATLAPGCNVQAMRNLTDATDVFTYLTNLRDGRVVAGSTPTIGSSKVGVAKDVAFSFSLTNYRGVATSYTVSVSGGSVGDYSVQSFSASGTGCSGSTLPAATTESGSACTISGTVRFTPSASGSRTTTLTASLTSAPAGQSKNVYDLSGTGERPTIASSLISHAFTGKVGTTVTQTFTISNSGTVALDLTSITVSPGPPYTMRGGTCATAGTSNVGAGGSCTVIIGFSPGAAGAAAAGTLSIGHDAGNTSTPLNVGLTGTGTVPSISSNIATLNFQNSQLGVPKAAPSSITLTNTGNADLVFPANPFALSGTNPGDFSFGGSCGGATVAPAGNCSVVGTFTPGAEGARGATLTINSDASNTAPQVVLLGTGVALPEPVVTSPNLAFPDTVIGETATQTRQVTISNDRTRDISYSVADTSDFKISSHSCATRVVSGGGGSCTVTWRFQPLLGSGEGERKASIEFSFLGTLGDPAPSNARPTLSGFAQLPIAQSATTLDATAVGGSPTTSSLLLTNRSASSVTVSSLAFSGAASTDYSLDTSNGCTVGTVLAAGTNCSLVLRFDPPAAGPRNATLIITHGAPGSPQSVMLIGTATPRPQGRIELSTFALNFGDVQLNGNASQPITVQNSGNLVLNFSAFNLIGVAAGDYTRSGTCSTATALAIGAQCSVTMTFAPTALNARNAALTILSDASNGPATIALTGNGVPVPAPQVGLQPATIDFDIQTVGGIFPKRIVRLNNTGTAGLSTSAIVVEGNGFANASATACPAMLAPGAGCDIEVLFVAPAAGIDFTGAVRVTSNAAGSPHTAALRGRGSLAAMPVLVWSPAVTELRFGNVSSGTVSAAQSATLLNQGPGGVNLNVLNAVGSDAAAFSVAGGTCQVGQPLFGGQSCRVDVTFAPSIAGAKSATVQVATTGSFPPALALTGTGLGGPAPGLAVSQAGLSFGAIRVGAQSLPSTITVSSTGSGAVRITALDLSGPYAMQGRTCPGLPFTLPAGGQCTLSVMFVPQGVGDAAGTLRLSSDADPAPREIALSGRGEAQADVSSGGCSIASGESATDPTLWLLVLLANLAVLYRRRCAAHDGRRRP